MKLFAFLLTLTLVACKSSPEEASGDQEKADEQPHKPDSAQTPPAPSIVSYDGAIGDEAALQKEHDPSPPSTSLDKVIAANRAPVAEEIPGKPGFVFNPWTKKAVDVRGLKSGTLIRDPADPNPEHTFRVP